MFFMLFLLLQEIKRNCQGMQIVTVAIIYYCTMIDSLFEFKPHRYRVKKSESLPGFRHYPYLKVKEHTSN